VFGKRIDCEHPPTVIAIARTSPSDRKGLQNTGQLRPPANRTAARLTSLERAHAVGFVGAVWSIMIKPWVSACAVVAISIVVLLTGCSSPLRNHQVYEYQCCSATDIDTIYTPGQTVALHWTPHRTTVIAPVRPSDPSISATLYGPYPSVSSIKDSATSPPGKPFATAKLLRPSIAAAQRNLSSDLPIPSDAAPGYYRVDMTTTWSKGNFTSGSSIIQIR